MANETDLVNYWYITTVLTDALNTDNPLIGIWKATNTYTNFTTQYIVVGVLLLISMIVFRFYGVNYLKNVTVSLLITTLLTSIMVIMGVVQIHVFVILSVLLVGSAVYYKYSDN